MSATAMPDTASPEATAGLRVVFLSDSLPERNGTGAYYHDLVAQLRPHAAAMEILQPAPRAGLARGAIPLPGDATQRLMVPNLLRIRRRLKALRPDLIVSVTPGPFGLLGPWLARRHGCGFICAYHTHFDDLAGLYWGPFRRRAATACLRAVNRYLCRRGATVLANNRGLIATLEDLAARHVDIVGTPVDGRFLDAPRLPPPDLLTGGICFAGRLATEKNIATVLETARLIPDIPFSVAGDGPLRAEVEAAAAALPNLDYAGWVDREGLRDIIDASALLVLPSHSETFGSVALEAMARARPALVSAAAGIHDWPELAGGLFTLGRDEFLVAAIGRVRELSAADWAATGERARAAAVGLNERTLEQWLAIMNRHRRGGGP